MLNRIVKEIFYKIVFFRINILCKKTQHLYMLYKDQFHKKRCFIVANGPSLRIEDLEKINDSKEVSFGMNRIYVLYDRTNWRPTYYVVQDPHLIRSCHKEISENVTESIIFARIPGEPWFDLKKSITFNVDYNNSWKNIQPFFLDGTNQIFADGKTVTYTAIQLAAYMGFSEIYLVGVDCNYSSDNTISAKSYADGRMYDKDKVGMNPDIKYNLLAYQAAKQYADTHNIKIYNATRGGKLEVFERVDFDKLFESEKNEN